VQRSCKHHAHSGAIATDERGVDSASASGFTFQELGDGAGLCGLGAVAVEFAEGAEKRGRRLGAGAAADGQEDEAETAWATQPEVSAPWVEEDNEHERGGAALDIADSAHEAAYGEEEHTSWPGSTGRHGVTYCEANGRPEKDDSGRNGMVEEMLQEAIAAGG
jgi:hypothetical protein